jgi:molecular chaperone DnaJ
VTALSQNSKRDYYEVLGVTRSSTDDEIKKAFRKLAKDNHPDLNPGDKAAEARFKEINEAYEVLSDPEKKARYDQYGHMGVDPNFAGGGSPFGGFDMGDMGDLFDSLFGSFGFGGGATRARNPNAPIRGGDIDIGLVLSFEEAALGCKKTLNINRRETCPECSGSGAKAGTSPEVCPDCGGSGRVSTTERTIIGVVQTQKTCPRCRGRGRVIKEHCPNCAGEGRMRRDVKLEVTVPAGIDNGQVFSLRGQGDHGLNGGPPGDVNVAVSVRPDPIFRREGFDVWCDLPVTFAQAVLGDEVTVPTLTGKVKYTVGEGTQPGTIFRLKGKGIPYLNGRGQGDQYVRVEVEVPTNLSREQKNALSAFEKTLGEKNYQKRRGFFHRFRDRRE